MTHKIGEIVILPGDPIQGVPDRIMIELGEVDTRIFDEMSPGDKAGLVRRFTQMFFESVLLEGLEQFIERSKSLNERISQNEWDKKMGRL